MFPYFQLFQNFSEIWTIWYFKKKTQPMVGSGPVTYCGFTTKNHEKYSKKEI